MSTINMIQVSEAEQAQLPESPVGLMELTDADLGEVGGGWPVHWTKHRYWGGYCRWSAVGHLHTWFGTIRLFHVHFPRFRC